MEFTETVRIYISAIIWRQTSSNAIKSSLFTPANFKTGRACLHGQQTKWAMYRASLSYMVKWSTVYFEEWQLQSRITIWFNFRIEQIYQLFDNFYNILWDFFFMNINNYVNLTLLYSTHLSYGTNVNV